MRSVVDIRRRVDIAKVRGRKANEKGVAGGLGIPRGIHREARIEIPVITYGLVAQLVSASP